MFQQQYNSSPMDPELLDQYNTELSNYNNKIMLAIIALRGALLSKYKLLKAELQNQYNLGQNLCSDTLISVIKVLQNYAGIKGASTFSKEENKGMSFYQSEDCQVKGTNSKLHTNVVCHKCKLKGYY